MSQTQGARTTQNSRRAGTVPGLSATRRSSLAHTPSQTLSTFGSSSRPKNILQATGAAPASITPSISARISAFESPRPSNIPSGMMQGDPEHPNSPTSPLEYYDRDDAPLDDGPPEGPPEGNDPDDGPPGGDGNPGEDPDYDPDDHPTPPGSPPGTPDMAGQFLGAIQSLATNLISMQRPAATPRPEKVKVREPEPFDGSDPRKLRSFLVSCNLHF